ncbi:MAG: hypothetical protein LUE64_01975, partial [Candidatus Gastranaerophilales bacterium]|nr:hypothetical protein [Candidatus Gastranaerophilales bacterium]
MKRLRIVQQIIIVVLFAVIVPFVTIGLIISNVSQQSVRKELNYSVTQISKYIADSIERSVSNDKMEFSYIAAAINNMPSKYSMDRYIDEIERKNLKYSNLKILDNTA